MAHLETASLLAHFVAKALAERKLKGEYSGQFAPVTHFFGYQGRAAHPSLFDCSLGSTMGFAAGVLIKAGLNGVVVSVKGITAEP